MLVLLRLLVGENDLVDPALRLRQHIVLVRVDLDHVRRELLARVLQVYSRRV